LHAGLNLSYKNRRPVVRLVGISVWGVPLPNAWLGNMKNVDLIEHFGDQGGFWQALANGIADIQVSEGKLRIELAP
ncbi:MAG: arginine N-succinyltransferase, partial [Gammaproteobacteria bacterium]